MIDNKKLERRMRLAVALVPTASALSKDARSYADYVISVESRLSEDCQVEHVPTESSISGKLLAEFCREWPGGYTWVDRQPWGDDTNLRSGDTYDCSEYDVKCSPDRGGTCSFWSIFKPWYDKRQGAIK